MEKKPDHSLSDTVNAMFGELGYSDPDDFGGFVSMRIRTLSVRDPVTDKTYRLSDTLFLIDASSENNLTNAINRRVISLSVGEGLDQKMFNLNVDENVLTSNGLFNPEFSGDLEEEFKAGLRVVANFQG